MVACTSSTPEAKTRPEAVAAPMDRSAFLRNHALQVQDMLMRKDYNALAAQIEPGKSLLFSPYGFIDSVAAKRLTAADLKAAATSKEKMKWGDYDGTGEPIRLTVEEYFAKFVNNKMYMKGDSISVNKSVTSGNTINNLKDVFPNHDFVEYYVKGTEKYADMDWGALRLVFKTVGDKTYLVAVVHDQWTS